MLGIRWISTEATRSTSSINGRQEAHQRLGLTSHRVYVGTNRPSVGRNGRGNIGQEHSI